MQNSGPVFASWIEQFEKTKVELELIKFEDCFLDDHGDYTSKLVFQKSFVNYPFSDFQRKLYNSYGSSNYIIIKPIRGPTAKKNAITEKVVKNLRQTRITHS